MLKVKNLSKTIKNKTILKDMNFEIDHGQIAIFLGESGAGKSTLLRVLNHLESFNTGAFTLDGTDLNLENVNQRNVVGMVFQHFNLFEHLNAEENITLPLTRCKGIVQSKAECIANTLLMRYGLQDHAKTNVSRLSGGQKQRLAIARTLAVDPKIVCLDEPTSALDPRLTSQVAHYINELATENRIVLLTTHDMGLLEQLNGHLFLVEQGTVVESAPKKAWTTNPSAYPKLQSFLQG